MKREFGVAPEVAHAISDLLKEMGWWGRWAELAHVVKNLSDHFHRAKAVTPWAAPENQAAYLAYFFPLNLARMHAVVYELKRVAFPLGSQVIDFGAGPGTASIAWPTGPESWRHVEVSDVAQSLHRRLWKTLGRNEDSHHWQKTLPTLTGATVIASYALNENLEIHRALMAAQSLILVEPSTQIQARRLMTLRAELSQAGFFHWAPCTHQLACPLLIHTKTDWCHDRIFFLPPPWWPDLERHLPMKNQTLTFSYLFSSRAPPSERQGLVRVIGDTLYEKGKIRQAVCRNDQREFLSWLKKHGEPEMIPHGSRLELADSITKKGNELRVEDPFSVRPI